MEIKKLDKRNKGHEHFKYFVRTSILKGPNYHEIREWCWQTWGSSKELIDWVNDDALSKGVDPKPLFCQNQHWTWQNDEYYRRIYLKGDAELMMFKLKWE